MFSRALVVAGVVTPLLLWAVFRQMDAAKSVPVVVATPRPVPSPSPDLRAVALRQSLRQNFGAGASATAWHRSIQSLEVDGDKVTVNTDLAPGSRDLARDVCGGVSGVAFSRPGWGFDAVDVRNRAGVLSAYRRGIGGHCETASIG